MTKNDLTPLLNYIRCSDLTYQEWVNVGMALHYEGYPCEVWEDWSRTDGDRFHPGECRKKWSTFHGSTKPVTGATITEMAKRYGWRPSESDYALAWDSVINDERVYVDAECLDITEISEPQGAAWNPAEEVIRYLETLFNKDDYVGYVTESFYSEDEEKYKIKNAGAYAFTAGQLIDKLKKYKEIGSALGDYDEKAGAWIRFNPLDGKGAKDENVTAYRYALVESDGNSLGEQVSIIKEMELPVAALVYSGNKSVHAIVRVDARNANEYADRVNKIYAVCEKNGLKVDGNNRNPSRLSRMPGVIRDGHKQFLIETNIGKANYQEWKEYYDDNLPVPENLADYWDNMPELSPPLIEGVLRQGHKMLLAGPSKAGKTFALMQLCVAIAEGGSWFGWQCAQGKVMYVNLELDRASCLHRFKDIYEKLGIEPNNIKNIDIWNLRGKAVPLDRLAPKLIRRASKKGYVAGIIDPIYKVITGDENSADQMAHFCNQFDKIATELECAVIYCHHHSKGLQGGKRSMDRASGSGVFARDPDALLDMIEIFPDEETRLKRKRGATAWRITGTLREFEPFSPVHAWYEWPIHNLDDSDAMKKAPAEGDKRDLNRKSQESKQEGIDINLADLDSYIADKLVKGQEVTEDEILKKYKYSHSTLVRRLKDLPQYKLKNKKIVSTETEQ